MIVNMNYRKHNLQIHTNLFALISLASFDFTNDVCNVFFREVEEIMCLFTFFLN